MESSFFFASESSRTSRGSSPISFRTLARFISLAHSEEDLQIALETQVQQRFDRMFGAEEATFYYSEHVHVSGNETVRMGVTQLLLESARKSDELQQTKPDPVDEEDSWSTPQEVKLPTDWKSGSDTTDGPGSWDSPLDF